MVHVIVVLALLALFLMAISAFSKQWRRRNLVSGKGCPANVPCSVAAPPAMPMEDVQVIRDAPDDAAVVVEVSPYMPKSCGGAPCSPDLYQINPQKTPVLHRGPGSASGMAIECTSLAQLESACKQDAVVLFHMTGCGPCQAFKPTFYQAATKAMVPFFAIDAMTVPDVVNRYNLVGFPSIFKFSNGKIVAEYKGNRTEGDLLMFASGA